MHTMTAARLQTRLLTSLAHKGRMNARAHPYVAAAAATAGALAILALVNRRLAMLKTKIALLANSWR
jgi:hypothetical protein